MIGNNAHIYFAENHNIALKLKFYDMVRFYYPYRNVIIGHGNPVDWTNDKNYNENVAYTTFVRDVANTYKTKEEYTSVLINKYPDYQSRFVVSCPFGCP